MLHQLGPLTRTDVGMVYRGPAVTGRQRQRRASARVADVSRRGEQGRHSARDALVERLVEVCRPDDDGKDAERGEAADEEPSDGRRGYTVQRRRQGQRLSTNTPSSNGRRGYTVQQWWQ